jgi:hypothetical protein
MGQHSSRIAQPALLVLIAFPCERPGGIAVIRPWQIDLAPDVIPKNKVPGAGIRPRHRYLPEMNLHRVSPGGIRARPEHLHGLLREDAQRARLEILKHLDGDLTIRALSGEAQRGAGHPFEITGRIKRDGLLAHRQEAGCATLVAEARNAECDTVSEVYWVDLVKPVRPKNPFNTPTDSTVSIP